MTEVPPPRKGKKIKKKVKSHTHQEKHLSEVQQPNIFQDPQATDIYANLPNQKDPHTMESYYNAIQDNQLQQPLNNAQNFVDQNVEEPKGENFQTDSQTRPEKNEEDREMKEFRLRFQRSVLSFHYNEDNAKVPIYLKESVLFIILLERLNQILKDFSRELHENEKEFISGMTLYSTYFSLISVNQAINLKKMFHQKNAESLHTMRSAHMAKIFHHFLKKNQAHWR